jgi:hypothetical protein
MNLDAYEMLDLDHIEAVVEPFRWSFAAERAEEIEAIWQREIAARPRLFNGPVLIQHRGHAEGRHRLAAQVFTDRGAQHGTAISKARIGRAPCPLELDVP